MMAMTTTIIKKNANLSTGGVRTRARVSSAGHTKGTRKAEAGKVPKERADRQTPAGRQPLLRGLRDKGHFKSISISPPRLLLWRLIVIMI